MTEQEAKAAHEAAKKKLDEARIAYLHAKLEDEMAENELTNAKARKSLASKARSIVHDAMLREDLLEQDAFMKLAKIQINVKGRTG